MWFVFYRVTYRPFVVLAIVLLGTNFLVDRLRNMVGVFLG